MGLFAIHDDEDVAEAKGVPTFRYKLLAFALSAGIAGAVGGIHAMYVGFLTVAGTFELTVPLYVVLMSVLGRLAPLVRARRSAPRPSPPCSTPSSAAARRWSAAPSSA